MIEIGPNLAKLLGVIAILVGFMAPAVLIIWLSRDDKEDV